MSKEHQEFTQIGWACSAQSPKLLPKQKVDAETTKERIDQMVNRYFDG